MNLGKYSFGIGDRFGHQGQAQLNAFFKALDKGISITPVWNKSNREHLITGTHPASTKVAADQAVLNAKWSLPYYIDADHINLSNVDGFINHSNFFTIDVANFIEEGFEKAIEQAGIIYRYILSKKGNNPFITEISMDEVEHPQTPDQLYHILKLIADQNIPVNTIAPKFSGRFNKGVDYVGNIQLFEKEFEQDIITIEKAIRDFNLPPDLKLSVHSGSDKFSLYPIIRKIIHKHDKGIHIKTAGTTWLEELIGLSLSDPKAVRLVKKIYEKTYLKREQLCEPYKTVIDVNPELLPKPEEMENWTGHQLANAITHNPQHPEFNPSLRQLLHVGYKIAADLGEEYTQAIQKNAEMIGQCVTLNLFERHIKPLFLD
jgi:tagaturonate epimerase